MKKAIKKALRFTKELLWSVHSVQRIARSSKFSLYNQFEKIKPNAKVLRVLGNGPSLSDNLDSFVEENVDYCAVNMHIYHSSFAKLKPKYYCLMDPGFFTPEHESVIDDIFSMTTWDMYLFIPYNKKFVAYMNSKKNWQSKYIKLKPINTYMFKGFVSWKYFLYNHNLSMPSPQNVIVAAIYAGICLRYETIEIYGVTNSFHGIFVDQNNEVYVLQPHFYEKEKGMKPERTVNCAALPKLHSWLYAYAKTFEMYCELRKFADKIGIRIINKTLDSFVDAFERR